MAFLVRFVHVAAVSFLFGGALLLCLLAFLKRKHPDSTLLRELFVAYEWGFWGAIGLVVMTGVGNLGAFGASLPAPETQWGTRLITKLALVLALVVVSVLRTLSVVFTAAGYSARPAVAIARLAGMYGITAIFLSGIVALAVRLAHF